MAREPRNVYYALINVALTGAERDAFFDLNKQEGDTFGPFPHLRNHQKLRLDGEAIIFQGDFPQLTPGRMISLLAQIGVTNTRVQPQIGGTYGDEFIIQTQPPGSTDLCRMIIFGGVGTTFENSNAAVKQYLIDNALEWEDG